MKIINILINSIFILYLSACANNPIRSYKDDGDKMLTSIYNTPSNTKIAPDKFGDNKNPDILFHMEYGAYLRMVGDITNSDMELAIAQNYVNNWVYTWKNTTSGKVATITTQMLINDSVTEYEPHGYEKTMLATLRALNHIDDNNWDNARIEIKRMYEVEQAIENYNAVLYAVNKSQMQKIESNKQKNDVYATITQKYNFEDINSPQVLKLKNGYQNAFSHYLAGFVFEALHEDSLSRPGYLKSGQLSPLNKLPQHAIDNIDNGVRVKPGYSDVLIIEEVGHAPQVKSKAIHIPFPIPINGNICITNLNIFFPELVPDKYNANKIDYQIDNRTQNQELFTDFNLLQARVIHDNMPHIISRNIAAAMRNISASVLSCSLTGNNLLSIGTSIAGAFIDNADERTWVLLPSKIFLNRVQLTLGNHTLTVMINGIIHTHRVHLTAPYQIISIRILNNEVFINK